jgi:hypothetical protein
VDREAKKRAVSARGDQATGGESVEESEMTEERRIRQYALHCCLCVIRRGEAFALFERVPGSRRVKSLVGTYRSWPAVKRGIERYNDRELVRSKRVAVRAR